MITRSERRVLLLNGTHPLGSAIVRNLMTTTTRVTSVFPTNGDTYLPGVQLQRGTPSLARLRSLLAVGEFDLVIHHAETRAEFELTRELLTLLRQRTDVLLTLPHTSRVTISPIADTPIRLGIARLPELFGPHCRDPQSWCTRAFMVAASGYSVPRPSETDAPVLYLEDAAAAIVAAADRLANATTPLVELPLPCSTRGELHKALHADSHSPAIATTLAWYREQPHGNQDESLGRAA
jgi:hypothetical protein